MKVIRKVMLTDAQKLKLHTKLEGLEIAVALENADRAEQPRGGQSVGSIRIEVKVYVDDLINEAFNLGLAEGEKK